jgi:hypothetical protein
MLGNLKSSPETRSRHSLVKRHYKDEFNKGQNLYNNLNSAAKLEHLFAKEI